SNLGTAWNTSGDAKKAISCYERALVIDETTYGKDHPKVAIDLNNLGMAWKTLGNAKKAIKYYERSYETDITTYGKDHPSTKTIKGNLEAAYKIKEDNIISSQNSLIISQ